MEQPLLSVCVISYNHAAFIRQALESVAMQKVNFPMELIIADDCSTDGTVEIIEDFIKNYNGKMIFLKREKNIGAADNFVELIEAAKGKYVAYLEGDDYWTSPDKLQIQVGYLEANETVALSSHNSNILLSNGETYLFNRERKYLVNAYQSIYHIENYIILSFFHSSAIVYRCSALRELPEWYKNAFGGDYFLVLLIAMNGDIHYINDSFSVYRINEQSISNYSSRYEIYKNFDLYLSFFNQFAGYKYDKFIKKKLFSHKFFFYYYHPGYFRKLWFVLSNFLEIGRINREVISRSGRYKILIPTVFLKSKVNLFSRKQR